MNLREDDMVTVLKEVNDVPVSHTHKVAKSEMKLKLFLSPSLCSFHTSTRLPYFFLFFSS